MDFHTFCKSKMNLLVESQCFQFDLAEYTQVGCFRNVISDALSMSSLAIDNTCCNFIFKRQWLVWVHSNKAFYMWQVRGWMMKTKRVKKINRYYIRGCLTNVPAMTVPWARQDASHLSRLGFRECVTVTHLLNWCPLFIMKYGLEEQARAVDRWA